MYLNNYSLKIKDFCTRIKTKCNIKTYCRILQQIGTLILKIRLIISSLKCHKPKLRPKNGSAKNMKGIHIVNNVFIFITTLIYGSRLPPPQFELNNTFFNFYGILFKQTYVIHRKLIFHQFRLTVS